MQGDCTGAHRPPLQSETLALHKICNFSHRSAPLTHLPLAGMDALAALIAALVSKVTLLMMTAEQLELSVPSHLFQQGLAAV